MATSMPTTKPSSEPRCRRCAREAVRADLEGGRGGDAARVDDGDREGPAGRRAAGDEGEVHDGAGAAAGERIGQGARGVREPDDLVQCAADRDALAGAMKPSPESSRRDGAAVPVPEAVTSTAASTARAVLPPPCTTVRPPCRPGTATAAAGDGPAGVGERRGEVAPSIPTIRHEPVVPEMRTRWPARKPSAAQEPLVRAG